MPTYKRDSVVPHPGGDDTSVIVVFKDEKGRLRNETLVHPGLAARYEEHQQKLDNFAEEYSKKRAEIEDGRGTIDAQAFSLAEQAITKRETEAAEAAATEAKAKLAK